MPKKRNFLGGMQNYNAQTGEYEPALKGPNGESPSGFKSFKKQEDKDESFDTINKKRMGKEEKINFDSDYYKIKSPEITNTDAYLTAPIVSALEKAEGRTLENDELRQIVKNMASKNPNATPEEFEKMLLEYKGGLLGSNNDFTSEDYVDDFYDRVSDLQKEVNTSGIDDDEYDAEINKLKEELETKKDSMSEDDYNKAKEMLDRFSRPTDDDFDANDEVTDDEISEHLADYQWQVTPKTTAGQYAQECADRLGISKERVFNIIKQQAPDQIKESSNMSKIIDAGEEDYEYIDDDNGSFDQINAKRMGKERAKPFKMPGTLRQRYNDYLRNGFSGKDIDKWNKEIEFIESKLPFKDEQEHQKWLDMASNWKGEPEWINMTNELIDRYNKSGEGGMDIEFRNFIKNPYDYEGTHSKDLINMVVEHGRKNYPNHPYFNKKSKLPF